MCYSSPPVYKVRDDLAIFAYHRDFQSSSRSLTKVRDRFSHAHSPAYFNRRVRTNQYSCTMLVWHRSRSCTHITKRSEALVGVYGGNKPNQICFRSSPKQVFTLAIKQLFMLTCYSVRNPDRPRTIEIIPIPSPKNP